MPINEMKVEDNDLFSSLIELIQAQYPKIRNVVVSFKTPDKHYTFVSAPCALCAIDEAKENAIENGATHMVENDAKSLLRAVIDSVLEQIDKDGGASDGDDIADALKKFNLDSKTKH